MHLSLPLLSVAVIWLLCFSNARSTSVLSDGLCFSRMSGATGQQFVTTFSALIHSGTTKYSWKEGEEQCRQSGDHLVGITNNVENSAINQAIDKSISDCWIGLVDVRCLNHNWVWIDGVESDYMNWNTGEPNNDNECCTEICTNTFDCYICGHIKYIEPVTIPTTPSTTKPTTVNSPSTSIQITSSIKDTISTSSSTSTETTTIVALLIVKWKQTPSAGNVGQKPTNTTSDRAVNNFTYGLEPQPSNDVMYYDTQNETTDAKMNKSSSQNMNGKLSVIDANQIGQHNNGTVNNFADNEMYA